MFRSTFSSLSLRRVIFIASSSVVGTTLFYARDFPSNDEERFGPEPWLTTPLVDPLPLQLTRTALIGMVSLLAYSGLKIFTTVSVRKGVNCLRPRAAQRVHAHSHTRTRAHTDENYERFQRLINDDRDGRPLITVCNHSSMIDDPPLMAYLVGVRPILFPKLHRWGLCKSKICFTNPINRLVAYTGKTYPIDSGKGVEQPLFKYLGRRLLNGDWVHLFPEGHIVQSGTLGRNWGHTSTRENRRRLRNETHDDDSVLLWGVGKLATHVRGTEDDLKRPPIIIPYYIKGASDVLPHERSTNAMRSKMPRTGKMIRVVFGPPVEYEDLLSGQERIVDEKMVWDDPSSEEKEKYAAVTMRCQRALERLEKET